MSLLTSRYPVDQNEDIEVDAAEIRIFKVEVEECRRNQIINLKRLAQHQEEVAYWKKIRKEVEEGKTELFMIFQNILFKKESDLCSQQAGNQLNQR